MSGRDAGDVGIDGDVTILVAAHEQEIADRDFIQLVANLGVQAHALEAVAAHEEASAVGVVERLDAELVDRAHELAARRVPEREAEVAEQVLEATLAPGVVGMQEELRVRQIGA